MELLLPHLLIEASRGGLRCRECGDKGFKNRDSAIFHVESEHVYYDNELHKWCRKVTMVEHRRELEEQQFQEHLRDFASTCVSVAEVLHIPKKAKEKTSKSRKIETKPQVQRPQKVRLCSLAREDAIFSKELARLAEWIAQKSIDSAIQEVKQEALQERLLLRQMHSREQDALRLHRRAQKQQLREEYAYEKALKTSSEDTINDLFKDERTPIERPLRPVKVKVSYSREELIGEYRRVKDLLDRTLSAKDLKAQSIIPVSAFVDVFGSWYGFLKEIGEEVPRVRQQAPKYTEEELTEEYHRLEKDLGRQPVYTDFDGPKRTSRIHVSLYERRFGSWGRFLEKVGGKMYTTQRAVSKQDLIDNYYQVKEKLGRKPNHLEIGTYGLYKEGFYRGRFGSYGRFLVEIGECKLGIYLPQKYSQKQLLEIYSDVKCKIGRPPGQADLRRHGVSESAYIHEWGRWKAFKEFVGDKINYHGEYSREDIIVAYQKAKVAAGRVPHQKEIIKYTKRSIEPIKRHFGDFKGLIVAMGDTYIRHNIIPVETHVSRYMQARQQLGRPPNSREYLELTGVWPDSAASRFGGYRKFVAYCEDRIFEGGTFSQQSYQFGVVSAFSSQPNFSNSLGVWSSGEMPDMPHLK